MDTNEYKNIWDKFYSEEDGYLETPDDILINLVRKQELKKAIDIGAGNGRHTIYLATKNIEVKAIDISEKGLSKIESWSKKNNLPVETVAISAIDYNFEVGIYDLAISTGSALNFFKKEDSVKIIKEIQNSVKVGGYVYITLSTIHDSAYQKHLQRANEVEDYTFYSADIGAYMTGYKENELRDLFYKFDILEYKEENILDDGHGEPHYHHTAVVLARRMV